MKKSKNILLAAIGFIALSTTSCKKNDDAPQQQPINNNAKITKLEYNDRFANISYDGSGNIAKIDSRTNSGNIYEYNFVYNNGKIKEVLVGATKWVYTYTLNNVTRVDLMATNGTLVRRYDYSYVNNVLVEQKEYTWSNPTNPVLVPDTQIEYHRNADGNIVQIIQFDYINNTWVQTGEVNVLEFDNKNNPIAHLESFPYIPVSNFTKNNPLKVTYKNSLGVIEETEFYEYTYNSSNNPVTRKKTMKSPGMPDYIENTRFFY